MCLRERSRSEGASIPAWIAYSTEKGKSLKGQDKHVLLSLKGWLWQTEASY